MDNTSRFKILLDISRALNSRYIYLIGNNIFAFDEFMGSNFKYTNINPMLSEDHLEPMMIDTEILKNVEKQLKEIKYKDDIHLHNSLEIYTSGGLSVPLIKDFAWCANDISRFNYVANTIANIKQPSFLTYANEEFHVSDDFGTVRGMKADEGVYKVFLDDRYMITLFPNLIRINKTDKASISIYDTNMDNTFLSEIIVVKKHFMIHNNIRFLKTL